MGFSMRGPLGLRLHFNSSGALRSFSLKSFAGMRAVYGSNGTFRGLSLPGIFKSSRIFTNSRGELTGFGLPRLFGGFLIFNNKAELKRIYSPVFGGVCFSHDPDGTKKKHELKEIKKHSFFESEARNELPETTKSFTRKGEVTEKGIVPISEKDIGMFNVKHKGRKSEQRDKVSHESDSDKRIPHEQHFKQESITSYVNNVADMNENIDAPVAENTSFSADDVAVNTPDKQSFLRGNTIDELSRHMIETEKVFEEAFSDREEIPFDEYCAMTKKTGSDE